MAGFTGRSPAFWRTTFSAAILFWIQMSWERFSILAFATHFVTTSGSPPTAGNHGPIFRGQAEATSSGLRLIGPAGQVMGFTTSFGLTSFLVRPANLAVPQTVA